MSTESLWDAIKRADVRRVAQILYEPPTCYACGEPATHEIQHRGAWLDVCDACDISDEFHTGDEP